MYRSNSITPFCPVIMLDKRITLYIHKCAGTIVCISFVKFITTPLSSFSIDTVYTIDSTCYKQLYQHNMHILCIYQTRTKVMQ